LKKISICFFAAIVLILYASVALADTNNVVIQWTIPSDTSFSISYPTGLTEVKFSPTSDTFTNEPAQSQTDTVASFELTNNGNLALNFTAVFETDMPSLPLVFKLISIFWPSDFVMFFLQREVVAGTLIIGGAIILRQFFIGIRSAIAIIVLLVVGSVFIAHLLF